MALTPLHERVEATAPRTSLARASPTRKLWDKIATADPRLVGLVSPTMTTRFVQIWDWTNLEDAQHTTSRGYEGEKLNANVASAVRNIATFTRFAGSMALLIPLSIFPSAYTNVPMLR